jgi:hypothetical protein
MTRSSTVFANWYRSLYPKTDHFHGIWLVNIFASDMATLPVDEVLDREKLYSVQLDTLGHQKSSITLDSLENSWMEEIEKVEVMCLRLFWQTWRKRHSDIEAVGCEALDPSQVAWSLRESPWYHHPIKYRPVAEKLSCLIWVIPYSRASSDPLDCKILALQTKFARS